MKKLISATVLATTIGCAGGSHQESTVSADRDYYNQAPKVMTVLTDDLMQEHFLNGEFCYQGSRDQAKELIKSYTAFGADDYFYGNAGLSLYSRAGEGFKVTFLDNSDIRKAIEVIDDELDLNFDHYRPHHFEAENIGYTFVINPCENSYLAKEALQLKKAIKDAYLYSEAEYTWQPVYIDAAIDFDYRSIRRAMGTSEDVYVWSKSESEQFMSYRVADDDWEYVHYVDLLEKLEQFGEYRVVKLGQEDTGSRATFIIVKSPRGQLIGLRSISVET